MLREELPSLARRPIFSGPDVEAYHNRQVAVLQPKAWRAWIELTKPEAELLKPLPAGSLTVETVRAASD